MATSSKTSSHVLSINDFYNVVMSCKEVHPDWPLLATCLRINPTTVDCIERGKYNPDYLEICLGKVITAWLKRDSITLEPLPSWRVLCTALERMEKLTLSEAIAAKHVCDCCICHYGSPPSDNPHVSLLSSQYDRGQDGIYYQLGRSNSVVPIAELLCREDVFSASQLDTIVTATGNERENLFSTLESVITADSSKLLVFATSLQQFSNTAVIGKYLEESYNIKNSSSRSLLTTTEPPCSNNLPDTRASLKHSDQLILKNVFSLLKGKSAQWNRIGQAFGVKKNHRDNLFQSTLLPNDRLESVLEKWLESSKPRPTWSDFMEVVSNSLEFEDVADETKLFLIKNHLWEPDTQPASNDNLTNISLPVDSKYEPDFLEMRRKLGKLCKNTITLLKDKSVKCNELKMELSLRRPELKEDLEPCDCVEEIMVDVIKPKVSVMQFSLLEEVFDSCNLERNALKLYEDEATKFLETTKIKHFYGRQLVEEHNCVSKPKSITLVLDWDNEQPYSLRDLQDLFKKLAKSYSKHIRVKVMLQGNSVIVECIVPAHLQLLIIKMIMEDVDTLRNEGVVSICMGGLTVFNSGEAYAEGVDAPTGYEHGDISHYEGQLKKLKERKKAIIVSLCKSRINSLIRQKLLDDECFFAVSTNDTEMLNFLLNDKSTSKFEVKDYKGDPLLVEAAKEGHIDVVRTLVVNKGIDADEKDKGNVTALMEASRNGYLKIVQTLFLSGKKVKVNAKNLADETPFLLAASNGHTEIVELLITKGAEWDCKDQFGHTPLIKASMEGHREVVDILLSLGANIEDENSALYTPLLGAALGGHTEIVKKLLSKGARVNIRNEDGFTPLIAASIEGHEDVVKLLLSYKDTDVKAVNKNNQTALHFAAGLQKTGVCRLLLDKISAVDEDEFGQSPAMIAAVLKNQELMKLFGVSKQEEAKFQLPAHWTVQYTYYTDNQRLVYYDPNGTEHLVSLYIND